MDTINKILLLVEESGLTAKEFAEKVGLGGGNITDWKTGRSKPSIESLQKIAKYTNVQLEWLTGNSKFKTKSEEKELLLHNLNEKFRNKLVSLGLNKYDIDELINSNPLFIDKKSVEEKSLPMTKKMQYIYYNYPIEISKDVLHVIEEILHEEKSIILQNDYDNLKTKFKELLEASNEIVEFIEKNNINNLSMLPVYGKISAGLPNWAEECQEGTLPIDSHLMNIPRPEEYFFLKVDGESMNQIIKNGSYALIRKQDYAEDGDIIVAIVNGDNEATLKKFKRFSEQFVSFEPMSSDDTFKPINVDLKNTKVIILGKYIGKFEMN